jgi:hypothetical protein
MIRLTTVALLAFAFPAFAQRAGMEMTPEQCSDHLDNDGDGRIDCADPKCASIGVCRALQVVDVESEGRLNPKSQIAAGAILIAVGPLLVGASVPVFTDARSQPQLSKSGVEYAMGAILCAAGGALSITGATTLRKGIRRHREDVEMGIAMGPTHLGLRLRF